MTNKELLELAAKAAGIYGEYVENLPLNGAYKTGIYDNLIDCEWNPLANDGDAFRLVVRLGVVIGTYANFSTADLLSPNNRIETVTVWHHETNGDPGASTRRSIVLAAAEIGKNL